ncbi:MAG: hypothetical protein ACP5OG_03875 [Candidatus Nanoarchaeia archaeon]
MKIKFLNILKDKRAEIQNILPSYSRQISPPLINEDMQEMCSSEPEPQKEYPLPLKEFESPIENKAMLEFFLSAIAFATIGIGFLFLSNTITGYTISDISKKSNSYIGILLLLTGLATGFFWLKIRKR